MKNRKSPMEQLSGRKTKKKQKTKTSGMKRAHNNFLNLNCNDGAFKFEHTTNTCNSLSLTFCLFFRLFFPSLNQTQPLFAVVVSFFSRLFGLVPLHCTSGDKNAINRKLSKIFDYFAI